MSTTFTKRDKRAVTIGLTLTAALTALFCVTGFQGEANSVERSEPTIQCEEDQPCWDWRTMGNQTAGGTLTVDGESIPVLVTVETDGSYTIVEAGK